jgi:hypothetical protein
MLRHVGIGDVETHPGRPRCFWGIGSRLGYPSKYQNRPRARRNHITASRTMFHTPTYGHVGEIPPSFDGIAQKQNARGRGGERDGSGMEGGTNGVFFAHARPTLAVLWTFPHTFPEDTNFAKHGDEGQKAKRMRDGQNSGGGGGGDKTSRPTRTCECRMTGACTHRAPKWTRRPRIPNSSKSVIWTKKKEKALVLGV